MNRYYILEGVFVVLGLILLITVIKYPKDVFLKLPLEIVKLPFRVLWELVSIPLAILAIPILYLGRKYKWSITPTVERLFKLIK